MSEVKVNKISPRTNCGTTQLGDAGDSIAVAACASFKTKEVKDASGNLIISRCGSNITIGSSGSSVALACGATQSGFGRSGSVNWDTTAKTTNFTAASGNGYFVNTTSGNITASLPAASAGDIVSFADYANTFQTNKLIISPNGSDKINGENFSYDATTEGISLTFVYVDSTRGWKNVNDGTTDATGVNNFVTATGGCVTCCGDYKVHTFTGPGTFEVTNVGTPIGSTTVEYLVVGGGAAGGSGYGGGGGAGGFRTNFPCGTTPVSVTTYPITVGAGGTAAPGVGASGSSSSALSITSAGGGGGAIYPSPNNGVAGGSGGGGSGNDLPATGNTPGGAGNTPPVSPPQGNSGGYGIGFLPSNRGGPGGGIGGGGGGGASASGSPATTVSTGGPGGNGTASSINFSCTTYAGGGGGGGTNPAIATGGTGGGGAASPGPGVPAVSGTANTGGGGGGNFATTGGGGGSGGSGIVIIRYKYQ